MDRQPHQSIALPFASLFSSGFAAIVFQEVWTKKATLLFGHTTYAITVVLSVFMAGLALGNLMAPAFLKKIRRPFLAYGFIELSIGTLGFSLCLLPWATLPTSHALKIVLIFCLFSPTFLMGLTIPLVVAGLKSISGSDRSFISKIYFINTLGAALGAIVGAFFLLPTFGNIGSALIAFALLVVAFGCSIPLRRVSFNCEPEEVPEKIEPENAESKSFLWVAFLFGAIGLSQEIVWTRLLSLIFGPSVYALGSVLFVYLSGIALGAWICDRYKTIISDAWISWNMLLTSAAIFFGMMFFGFLPYIYLACVETFHVGFSSLRVIEVVLGGLTLVPLAISQGLLLPALVIVSRRGRSSGEPKSVSSIFGSNTIGCIAGSSLTSLVFIPKIGLLGCLFGAAAVSVAMFLWWVPLGKKKFQVCSVVVALTAILTWSVASNWDHAVLASGIYKYAVREVLGGNKNVKLNLGTTEYFKEGLSSTVAVINTQNDLLLSVDGKVDASMYGDQSTQTLLAALPISFAKRDAKVLVIGLASGVTSGVSLLFDQTTVTTVEIEPAIIHAQKYFSKINHDPLKSDRHRLVIDDARSFLRKTGDRFDVITSEPSNPWMNGIAPLFTGEFFQLAEKHLSEDGVMCQWLPIYGMTPELVQSVIHTFSSVFPDFLVFESVEGFDLLLIGAKHELLLDPAKLTPWPNALAGELQRINIGSPEDLLGLFLAGKELRLKLPSQVRLNTDDNGYLEYGAPKALHLKTAEQNHRQLLSYSDGLAPSLPKAISADSLEKIKKKVFLRGDQAMVEKSP